MDKLIEKIRDTAMLETFLLASILNHNEVNINKNFIRNAIPIARRVEEKKEKHLSKKNKIDVRKFRKEGEELVNFLIEEYEQYSLNGIIKELNEEQKKEMFNILKIIKVNKRIFGELLINLNDEVAINLKKEIKKIIDLYYTTNYLLEIALYGEVSAYLSKELPSKEPYEIARKIKKMDEVFAKKSKDYQKIEELVNANREPAELVNTLFA